ncbi:MAG: cell wall metabolism sensor histidine kinase WalK [Defluviitaleaceae bacterium]|nr:cell wall metabolism sensor histidine kinase WalK [Defluviitaleaceae bacterium]
MRSIKTKLIVIYAAVVLVVMTVSGTFMLLAMRDIEVGNAHDRLRSQAVSINERIVQVYELGTFLDASWYMFGQGEHEIDGAILNNLGQTIAPLEFVSPYLTFNDSSVIEALAGVESFSSSSILPNQHGVEQQYLTFAMPVSRDGEDFIVFTRISAHLMNDTLSRMTFYFVLSVIIALVITVILWFFVGNSLTNPIVTLSRHAKAIASGDFSRKIDVASKDEIGDLAEDFNFMASELRHTLSEMASEKNKREAILSNTPAGMLAYDAVGRLERANTASTELLHGINIGTTHLSHVLSLLGFDIDDVKTLRPGDVRDSIYEEGEFYLSATVTAYSSEFGDVDGYLIVLQDISRQRKLDNMRKEFVANVSHELRTPLTSIRTYSETLLDGALDDTEITKKFLKVIDDEAQRMSILVTDLLELSRLDSKQYSIEMDVVDLVALIRLSIRQAGIQADTKGQVITFEMPKTPYFIEANAARINQVVYNILSNSIKYSPEDTNIRITLETTEKYFRVFIKDQGIGIPPESINRVFERFYRVDKARARAMGGTGLGLAIVKEIMEEHGGRVYATSQLGQGTTMVLRFNRLSEV